MVKWINNLTRDVQDVTAKWTECQTDVERNRQVRLVMLGAAKYGTQVWQQVLIVVTYTHARARVPVYIISMYNSSRNAWHISRTESVKRCRK